MSRTPPPLPSGPPPPIENSLSAVVVKEYAPIESNHIQLQIGDTIKVTDFGEKLFWYGTSSSGEQGLFPQSHVEVRGRGRGRGGLVRGRGGPEGRGGARHSSYVPSNPNPNPNPNPITPPANSTSPTNMRPKSGYTNNSPLIEPRTGGVPVRSASPSVPRPLPNPSDNNNNNGVNSPVRGAPRGRGVVRALSQSFAGTTSTSQPSPSNSPLRPSELNKSTNAQPNNNIQKNNNSNNNNNNNIIDNSNNGNSNDSINENLNHEQNANQSNQDQPKKKTREDLRNDTLQEIYITEKGYIEDLETLINVFIFPLRTMGILQESILYNIFSNVEVLINCNREMLKALEEKMNFVKENEEVSIGSCFTMLADYFKMYKVYCANQSTSLTTVDTQLKKNSHFKKKLDVCHSDPRCRGLFLQSFLIKPIQRVCKYPLLLRELIRYTPEDHPDYEPLQSAFNKINEVVTNINEGQREAEGLQYILDLQKLIEGIDTLVEPGRRFHKEGDLTFYKNVKSKHGEKRHVFFFSDLILLTVKKGEKRYEHKLSIPLENCTLIVLADTDYIKNAFELSQKQLKRPCILSGDSSEELNQWTREIKNLIKLYQKKQIELKKKGISSSED